MSAPAMMPDHLCGRADRSLRHGGPQLQWRDAAGWHLLQQSGLHLVLDHAPPEPLVAIVDDLLGVQFAKLPRPVHVLAGAVDRRCEEEEQEEGPDICLLPEVLLLEELAGGEALDAVGRALHGVREREASECGKAECHLKGRAIMGRPDVDKSL